MRYLLVLLIFLSGCASRRQANHQPLPPKPETAEVVESSDPANESTSYRVQLYTQGVPQEHAFNTGYYIWFRAFSKSLIERLSEPASKKALTEGRWSVESILAGKYQNLEGYLQIVQAFQKAGSSQKGFVLVTPINPLDDANEEAEKVVTALLKSLGSGQAPKVAAK